MGDGYNTSTKTSVPSWELAGLVDKSVGSQKFQVYLNRIKKRLQIPNGL